ncbi:MAG: glycosyltransferase family 4 protein, partial [Vicinamibacterales bacterium]
MRTAAVAFVLSCLCAAVLTPVVRRLALKWGLVDQAWSSRKIHSHPVPRLGGIALILAFFAPLLGLLVFESAVGRIFYAEQRLAIGLFVGGSLIGLLGLYDDLRGTSAQKKLAIQFAVAGLVYAFGFRIDIVANPFGDPIALGFAGLPFTLLWIVGVINAMNLIDGLDGLAGGVALVAVATTFGIAFHRGEPSMILICAALSGAIIGFLFYNFNPASIFMGDTGSMFLGFILATGAIRTHQKSSTAVAVLVPTIALGLPILDALLAVSRRAMRGRPLFRADKEHIHHRLLATGLSHRQAVLVLYGLCIVFGGIAMVLAYSNGVQTAVLLTILAGLSFLFLRRIGFMRTARAGSLLAIRRRGLEQRFALELLGERLRFAVTPGDIWSAVRDASVALGATAVRLE